MYDDPCLSENVKKRENFLHKVKCDCAVADAGRDAVEEESLDLAVGEH